jgi:hypothetical protein
VDYAIWREHYGNTEIPLLEVGSGESGADTGTAEAVTAGGELPYVPTGEAASAAGRVTNYFHAPTHEPTTTDAALLLLLADRRESISQGNAPFARTANTSLETPRDDFFATLGVDLSVAL